MVAGDSLRDHLDRLLSEACPRLTDADLGESGPAVTVRKASMWMPVSCCALSEADGIDHCEHEPWTPRRLTRRERLRSAWLRFRARTGRHVGSLIAGEPLHPLGECDIDD